MKKLFSLTSPKHKPDRVVELVKAEVNKYLARERRKNRPEGVDYWDFDCKCGKDAASALEVRVTELGKAIEKSAAENPENVYVEILAKPGVRAKRPAPIGED